jgi:hypothetical protein
MDQALPFQCSVRLLEAGVLPTAQQSEGVTQETPFS